MLRQDSASSISAATMPAATACGNCGMDERRLLHNVRHRGIFRRLCTSCVLRLHPQSFCPTCFVVYHPNPPPSGPNDAVTCFKCYSSSHSLCVGPNPPSPYICPNCVNPNSPIFTLKKAKDLNFSDVSSGNDENCRVIDKKAAKILLAAAKIAAVSMSKAALAARAEAERRAKEAAFTRRRAREALEHVMFLAAKEKMKKNEAPLASSVEVSRSGGNVGIVNNRVGNSSSGVVAGGALVGRDRMGNVERMDSSNEVVAALNKVDLREKEKLGGFKPESVVSGERSSNGVAMHVEENRGMSVASTSSAQNRGVASVSGRFGEMGHAENQNAQGEKASNGVVPVPAEEDQMQGVENSHVGNQDNSKPQ